MGAMGCAERVPLRRQGEADGGAADEAAGRPQRSSSWRRLAAGCAVVAVAAAVVAEAMAMVSRRSAPRRRKPYQAEVHICEMANLQLWQHGRRPNMLQPPLQPL